MDRPREKRRTPGRASASAGARINLSPKGSDCLRVLGLNEVVYLDHVYHYIQDRALKPDIVFDISEFVEQKHAAIMAFKSQFFDPTNTQPQTPISSADYLNALRGKDSVYGRYIGASYGEGFNVQRVVGVKNLFDLM